MNAARRKKPHARASVRRAEADRQLIEQAEANGARLRGREVDVIELAQDPGGDVIQRGIVKRHRAVRLREAWREMVARGVFAKARLDGQPVPSIMIEVALEWYQARLDTAESYSVKSGLDFSGVGGNASNHIPVYQAAIEAQSDVAWARGSISAEGLAVFDAVMRDGESFLEAARRMCASRYVRISVDRARRKLSEQFVTAACEFAIAHHRRAVPQQGRIKGEASAFARHMPIQEETGQ